MVEYTAEVVKETEKAYLCKPLNFEYNKDDLFIPKSAVDNWIVAPWLCARMKLDGSLALLLPEDGVKGIEKIGMWEKDPTGNNGGAKVTNANLFSTPVDIDAEEEAIDAELEEEFGNDDIDDLTDIDSDGEPEPEPEKEEKKKDPFGERAKKEMEKIKREQGLASKDEQTGPEKEEEVEDVGSTIPPEVEVLIEENAVLLEHTMRRGRKVVDNVFTDGELNQSEKAEMAQDVGISLMINAKRGY